MNDLTTYESRVADPGTIPGEGGQHRGDCLCRGGGGVDKLDGRQP